MDKLVIDSVNLLIDSHLQTVYNWMDYGDVLSKKQRNNIRLNKTEEELINNLTDLIKKVKLEDNIILYRGVNIDLSQMALYSVMEANQFNAMSPLINTCNTYGTSIMTVKILKGTNLFYISAWEHINTECEPNEEKEIVLLPGNFIFQGKENNNYNFLYVQY
jgi:hypothetical protein